MAATGEYHQTGVGYKRFDFFGVAHRCGGIVLAVYISSVGALMAGITWQRSSFTTFDNMARIRGEAD